MSSSNAGAKPGKALMGLGCLVLFLALGYLLWFFGPVLSLEAGFRWKQLQAELSPELASTQESFEDPLALAASATDNVLYADMYRQMLVRYQPKYPDYGIVIPKIEANARIMPDVDPFDINVYSKALGQGIAEASGSAGPGHNGNTFLFAHSGRNFYDPTIQNVQFYLLEKLEPDDQIIIFKDGKVYFYRVTDTFRVWPENLQVMLDQNFNYNRLTLMSCWPAGVNYQRQIVQARLVAKL